MNKLAACRSTKYAPYVSKVSPCDLLGMLDGHTLTFMCILIHICQQLHWLWMAEMAMVLFQHHLFKNSSSRKQLIYLLSHCRHFHGQTCM